MLTKEIAHFRFPAEYLLLVIAQQSRAEQMRLPDHEPGFKATAATLIGSRASLLLPEARK